VVDVVVRMKGKALFADAVEYECRLGFGASSPYVVPQRDFPDPHFRPKPGTPFSPWVKGPFPQ
jgi:hypothetical protein